MTQKPVLLIALAKRYGGAEVRVFDLAKAFHGRIPYAVVTIKGSVLDERLEAAGLHRRPQQYGRGDPRLAQVIGHLIRDEGYQIVDAHNPQSQLWGLLAGKRAHVPVLVSTVHLAYGRVQTESYRGWLYEQVLRLNRRWGCRFITVSESIRDYLYGLGVPQVSLIDNAVDLESIACSEPDLSWREALGWSAENVVFAVVGRLEPQKGHSYLIEALRLAVKKHPQIRCILVGEGHLRPSLERQITESNLGEMIHLAGFRRDVQAILSASDVFCLSSLAEGLPYAMLEAVAHRLPLLVTAVDGLQERLDHLKTAYLVPPAEPQALAEGMCWLVDHPEMAGVLGQAAYDMVRVRFSPDRMVRETLAIYNTF